MKHLSFSSKLFAILFVFSSLIYVGCHKDEVKELDSASPVSTQLRTVVTPTVENGTLKFTDEAHAISFYNYLNEQKKIDPSALLNLQSSLNYQSLTSVNEGLQDQRNAIFLDDAFNDILNKDYEVIIGNEIRVQKSLGEYYIIDKNDVSSRNVLKALSPGSELSITNLVNDITIVGDSRELLKFLPDDLQAAPPSGCECRVIIEDLKVRGVAVRGNYKFTVFCRGFSGTRQVNIDFGDGTTTTGTITSQNSTFTVNKFYAIETEVTVKITANLPCGTFTATRLLNPSRVCCKKFYDSGWKEKCDGNNCIWYTLRVFNNSIGVRSSQGKMESIVYKNGIPEKKPTSFLKIDLESSWRFCEIAAICNIQSDDTTWEQCNDCQKQSEGHNNYTPWSDPDCNKTGDVYARYKRLVSGLGLIEADLTATFCD